MNRPLWLRGAWLLLLFLAFGLQRNPLQAGHELFVPLLFVEAQEKPHLPKDRLAEPVSIGVPIPRSVGLRTLDRVVVVGTEVSQVRILGTWPDGSIRWIQVDARIDLPAGGFHAGLYVTEGKPKKVGKLASDEGQSILINTGSTLFRIPKNGPPRIFLRDQEQTPELALDAPNGKATLEENGPLRAAVRFSGFDSPTSEEDESFTLRAHFLSGKPEVQLVLSKGNPVTCRLKNDTVFTLSMTDANNREAALLRTNTGLELRGPKHRNGASPPKVVGRVAHLAWLNASHIVWGNLLPGAEPGETARFDLLVNDFLRAPPQHLSSSYLKIKHAIESGNPTHPPPLASLISWYGLTGNEAVGDIIRNQGHPLDQKETRESNTSISLLAEELCAWHLHSGSTHARDRLLDILYEQQDRLIANPSLLKTMDLLLRNGALWPRDDEHLLSLFESTASTWSRLSPDEQDRQPILTAFFLSQAWRLSANPRFLQRARTFLNQEPPPELANSPEWQNLRVLLTGVDQRETWRPFDVTISKGPENTSILRWTVPENAMQFRIRVADRPIVHPLDARTNQAEGDPSLPFFEAQQVSSLPSPGRKGEAQSHAIAPALSGEYFFAAGRYLHHPSLEHEKETRRPSRSPTQQETPPVSAGQGWIMSAISFMIIFGIAILGWFIWFRKSKGLTDV